MSETRETREQPGVSTTTTLLLERTLQILSFLTPMLGHWYSTFVTFEELH